MKRILILIAFVAMTISVNAATCNWTFNNIASDPTSTAKDSYMAYLVDVSKTSIEDMTTMLKAQNFEGLASSKIEASEAVTSLMNGRVYKSGFGDYTIGQDYTFYTVILNASTTEDASWFYITGTVTAAPTKTGPLDMNFANLTTAGMTTAGWTEIVPEPTSGLLLLVGGALLVLRRKQK